MGIYGSFGRNSTTIFSSINRGIKKVTCLKKKLKNEKGLCILIMNTANAAVSV